jgi:hypothetical protein
VRVYPQLASAVSRCVHLYVAERCPVPRRRRVGPRHHPQWLEPSLPRHQKNPAAGGPNLGRVLLFRAGRDGDSGPTFRGRWCCCRAARCTGVGARLAIKPCVGFVDQFAFGLRGGAGVRTNGYNPPEMNVILAGGRVKSGNGRVPEPARRALYLCARASPLPQLRVFLIRCGGWGNW